MIRNTDRSHLEATWLVIVNPQASNGRVGREWPAWKSRLATLIPNMEVRISTERGSATALIEEGVQAGLRYILAVGGDGIAHQVINGIMQQRTVPSTALTFALLPVGTGNDWIKTHQIPRQWEDWSSYFQKAVTRQQNLGKIIYQDKNGQAQRYFLNVAGLAYDAFVVQFTNEKTTRLPGKLFYFWATFRCLFQYRPQQGKLSFNEQEVVPPFYTINLGIGTYSGGGMQLVPHAEAAAKYMALTYVGKVSRLAVLLNSFRFYKGRIAHYSKASLHHTTQITVSPLAGEEILVEADGEFLGSSPTTITMEPLALKFLAPPQH